MKATHLLRFILIGTLITALAACAGTAIHPSASVMIGGTTGTR